MTIHHNLTQYDTGLGLDLSINGQRYLISIAMHQEQLHLDMYWLQWKMIDSPMDIYMTIDGHYYFEIWFTLLQITLKDEWTLMLVWRRDGHHISIWYNGFQDHIVLRGHLKARMIEAKARDFDFMGDFDFQRLWFHWRFHGRFLISRDFDFIGDFDFQNILRAIHSDLKDLNYWFAIWLDLDLTWVSSLMIWFNLI